LSEDRKGHHGRVLLVIGTRPEAIKMAPVLAALRQLDGVETRLALTGQHTTLVDQVLEVFDLRPDYDLEIMREGQSLYDVAHGCLDGLREVARHFRPDVLLVQGDTATVFYASLVGFFEDIRVGHVEAGLRSGRKRSPFPEEILRRLTDVIADFHFAPTGPAADNLRREGVPESSIFVTGNTVVDALLDVAQRLPAPANPRLRDILDRGARLVLLTAHRRESFGEPLRDVFRAVVEVTESVDDVEVLYPLHPNPNVRVPAVEILGGRERIHLTDPLGYLDLVWALRSAELILTDSGGIQEEAPTFGTPVLVLREVTERGEGVQAGVARLVGTDRAVIVAEARRLLTDDGARATMSRAVNPYGDGHASARIADVLSASLTGRARSLEDWGGAAPTVSAAADVSPS
jgi:UDP-N-acetylglucosamine 2-epimerase (non-hydrolysing)